MPTHRKNAPSRGLTLIELLVVVAVVAILAAIALPSLLQAQTRAKVSAAAATLRTGTTALEMYAVDNNRYPSMRSLNPQDPLGILAATQLRVLSTPVAYLTSSNELRDPFGTIQLRGTTIANSGLLPTAIRPANTHFPELVPPNQNRSLLYYHYPTLSRRFAEPQLNREAVALLSIGPDLRDSLGVFAPVSPTLFQSRFARNGINHPLDTIYDPTNGIVSEGDIPRFTGIAARPTTP